MRQFLLVALPCAALAAAASVLFIGPKRTTPARAAGPPTERALRHSLSPPKPHLFRHAQPLGALVVWIELGHSVALRSAPGGRVLAWARSSTEFGSPQTLAVVRRRTSRWLGVKSTLLGNDRLGWVDASAGGLRYSRTRIELDVALSARQLVVRRGGRVLRRIAVGIGRFGSTTPTGRFAITDKLPGARYSSVYGCCILALSGHQTNLPAGWSGGNRLAIHGGALGTVSAGCLHAAADDLEYLMRRVPLGTPVVISR